MCGSRAVSRFFGVMVNSRVFSAVNKSSSRFRADTWRWCNGQLKPEE